MPPPDTGTTGTGTTSSPTGTGTTSSPRTAGAVPKAPRFGQILARPGARIHGGVVTGRVVSVYCGRAFTSPAGGSPGTGTGTTGTTGTGTGTTGTTGTGTGTTGTGTGSTGTATTG